MGQATKEKGGKTKTAPLTKDQRAALKAHATATKAVQAAREKCQKAKAGLVAAKNDCELAVRGLELAGVKAPRKTARHSSGDCHATTCVNGDGKLT